MQNTIHEQVRQFVVQNFLFGQEPNFADDESFLDNGIIDSTGVLELVGFLETHFGIDVADDELVPANLDSVDAVARFVKFRSAEDGKRLAG